MSDEIEEALLRLQERVAVRVRLYDEGAHWVLFNKAVHEERMACDDLVEALAKEIRRDADRTP